MERFEIEYVDSSIDKLNNLELLLLLYSVTEIDIPLESIAKLSKLKAIVLYQMQFMTNNEIPTQICDLSQVSYFDMAFTANLAKIPFDCIANNWKSSRMWRMNAFPLIKEINPSFWQLPNLESVYFDWFDFDPIYFQLDTFKGFSNSLIDVSLSNNQRICNNTIIIDNIEYYGFDYLLSSANTPNFTADDVKTYSLLRFIQKFDPCSFPCDGSDVVC